MSKPNYVGKINKRRAIWELRDFRDHSILAKGDIKFIVQRMSEIPGGIYGSTHFLIPTGGYLGCFNKKG